MNASEAPPILELTPELQKLLDGAGAGPPVVIDRRTQETYVLVPVAVYEWLSRNETPAPDPRMFELPEGVKQARAAFLRDFASLMASRKTRGRYVCYHKDKCVAVAKKYVSLIDEINRLNVPDNEFLIFHVVPGEDRYERLIEEEADIEDF